MQELNSDMDMVSNKLDTRDDMIGDQRGINVNIFENLGHEIESLLNKVHAGMRDVDSVLEKVQQDRQKFQVSDLELQNRLNFSKKTKDQIAMCEKRLSEQNKHKFMNSFNQNLDGNNNFNDSYGQNGGQSAQMYEENQEVIDSIADNVTAGLLIGRTINKELEDQQRLLATLDDGVDNAADAMKKVTDQIKDIIESEGKTPTMVVAILSIAFIVLLFFVI